MKKFFKRFVLLSIVLVLIVFVANGLQKINHSIKNPHVGPLSDTVLIHAHLNAIVNTDDYRHSGNPEILNQVAAYIFSELSKHCDTVYYQPFLANGITYKNVIGVIGMEHTERYVVGAHYDVCGDQDGADDNATGVVGIIELARLSKNQILGKRIDFVAYTLEEPPYYATNKMGSYIHAKSLADEGVEIEGMVCLEMIGYFSDKKGSQHYPVGILKPFYGDVGNYISVVQQYGNGRFGRRFKRLMKSQNRIETKSLTTPKFIPGMDLSDHRNYWKFDYNAVMITNTAFYRNYNYHEETDKIETLNISKMAMVIDEVFLSLREI